jgi:hypothetical protein
LNTKDKKKTKLCSVAYNYSSHASIAAGAAIQLQPAVASQATILYRLFSATVVPVHQHKNCQEQTIDIANGRNKLSTILWYLNLQTINLYNNLVPFGSQTNDPLVQHKESSGTSHYYCLLPWFKTLSIHRITGRHALRSYTSTGLENIVSLGEQWISC